MGRRHRARELAIQVLFHLEFNPGNHTEGLGLICDNFDFSQDAREFADLLITGIVQNKGELDQMIRKSSKNWRLERMSYVDRNILRLAVFEILHLKDIPPKVSIDEAVELAKRYGTDESSGFINGVLDNIYNRLNGGDHRLE